MYKVTLELTHKGWEWKVWKDNEVIAIHKMIKEKSGARGTEKYSIFESALEKEGLGDLLEAIEDSDELSITRALAWMNEDEDEE